MTLGEKIKEARIKRGYTQAALAGDKITRNMLSSIENGSANPSIETLTHISKTLDIPMGYFFTEGDDLFIYKKCLFLPDIKKHYSAGDYLKCIKAIDDIGDVDDELGLLLTECHAKHGRKMFMNGSLKSAKFHLEKALEFSKMTKYDTRVFECTCPMYISVCKNIQSPLLEFDAGSYLDGLDKTEDYEFYKYITQDLSYEYKNPAFEAHMKAKRLIKERNLTGAVAVLRDLVDNRKYPEYNATLILGVYIDLENSYKQLLDYENAYRFANKKMVLIGEFNS